MRGFWSDALLRREIDLHGIRRGSGRNWSYPGPHWMLLTLLILIPFKALVSWQSLPQALTAGVCLSIVWQTWLLCLRASIACAVSVAEEVENKTLVVFLTTPLGLGRLLATKLAVCLQPLFVEIYFLAIFFQLLNYFNHIMDWHTLLLIQVFQGAATLFYGCLGLWLGALVGSAERAAGSARATAFMTMAGCILVEQALPLPWPLFGVAAMIWFCLVVQQPHSQPVRAYQSGVFALVMLLLIPLLYSGATSYLPNIELSHYSPLAVASVFFKSSASQLVDPLTNNSLLYLALAMLFGILSHRQVQKSF